MLSRYLMFIVLAGAAGFIGCHGGGGGVQITSRNCASPEECLAIDAEKNSACSGWVATAPPPTTPRFGTPPSDQGLLFSWAYNFHKTRDIVGLLERTVINASKRDEPAVVTAMPFVFPAKDKDPRRNGGPSGIDLAGPGVPLECQWQWHGDQLYRHTFKPGKLCFADDRKCQSQMPPLTKAEPRPPVTEEAHRCADACASGNPDKCLISRLPRSSEGQKASLELAKLHATLISATPPTGVTLDALFDAIPKSAVKSCTSRLLAISATGDADAYGPACRSQLPMPANTPANARYVEFDAPISIEGKFSMDARTAFLQLNPLRTVSLRFYTAPTDAAPRLIDPIITLAFWADRIVLTGQESSCMELEFDPSG